MAKIKNFFKKLGMFTLNAVCGVLMGVVTLISLAVLALPIGILAGIDIVCEKFEKKKANKTQPDVVTVDDLNLNYNKGNEAGIETHKTTKSKSNDIVVETTSTDDLSV